MGALLQDRLYLLASGFAEDGQRRRMGRGGWGETRACCLSEPVLAARLPETLAFGSAVFVPDQPPAEIPARRFGPGLVLHHPVVPAPVCCPAVFGSVFLLGCSCKTGWRD